MVYRLCYDDISINAAEQYENSGRTEYFQTEQHALSRARELLEGSDYHSVELIDGQGNVLAGIRLQLKLGVSTAE